MRTTRLRIKVYEYLKIKPKSTSDILDYINENTKHGTTTHVLGNILGKDARFKKVGTTQVTASLSRDKMSYEVAIWGVA